MPRSANTARKPKSGKKRSAGYFQKCAGKKPRWERKLDVGMSGVLITCNHDERKCTREAYDLMTEYADELYGPEVETEDAVDFDSSGDIADALEKEVSQMNEQRDQKKMRFQAIDSRANNVIFIRTNISDDPANFVHHILKKIKETGQSKSQHIQRMLPVTITCRANLEQIEKAVKPLLEPYFHSSEATKSTFAVLFKIRNNNEIRREEVITVVANAVTSGSESKHSVVLDDPDYSILVEIICNVCCLSVIKEYNLLKKYNVRAVAGEPLNMGQGKRDKKEKSIASANGDKHDVEVQGVKQNADEQTVMEDAAVPDSFGKPENKESSDKAVETCASDSGPLPEKATEQDVSEASNSSGEGEKDLGGDSKTDNKKVDEGSVEVVGENADGGIRIF